MPFGLIGVMVAFGAYLVQAGARLVDPAVAPLETSDAWWRIVTAISASCSDVVPNRC